MEAARTDYLFGDVDFTAIATNLRCSHCHSDPPKLAVDPETGLANVQIGHDDSCPVLNGVLPSAPDIARAVAGAVPDTFRP